MIETYPWTGGVVFSAPHATVIAAESPAWNLLAGFAEPGAVFGFVLDGQNAVLRMAEIVTGMVEAGLDQAEIYPRLGMEDEELERLLDRAGMTLRGTYGKTTFGRAWQPARNP